MPPVSKKFRNKCGKKLFTSALDELYYFDDDKIEDLLDKAILKFRGRVDWRKATRSYVWSFHEIREAICAVGYSIYGPLEGEDEIDDLEDTDEAGQ
jgi:hypothetical protein